MLAVVASFAAYSVLAVFFGFYEATFLYLLGMPFLIDPTLLRAGMRRRLVPLVYAALTVLVLFLAFERFMRVLVPSTLIG